MSANGWLITYTVGGILAFFVVLAIALRMKGGWQR